MRLYFFKPLPTDIWYLNFKLCCNTEDATAQMWNILSKFHTAEQRHVSREVASTLCCPSATTVVLIWTRPCSSVCLCALQQKQKKSFGLVFVFIDKTAVKHVEYFSERLCWRDPLSMRGLRSKKKHQTLLPSSILLCLLYVYMTIVLTKHSVSK